VIIGDVVIWLSHGALADIGKTSTGTTSTPNAILGSFIALIIT